MSTVTRRTALATTGASLAAALVGFAAHAATPSSLAAKMAVHAAACRAEDAAFADLAQLDLANPIPLAKVQYGRLLRGQNDDGTDEWEPLYAHTETEITRSIGQHISAHRSIFGSHGIDRLEAKRDRLIAELRQKQAERIAARDACGITAASERTEGLSDARYEARCAIIEHEHTTLDELRQAPAHLAKRATATDGDPDYEVARLALAFAGVEAVER